MNSRITSALLASIMYGMATTVPAEAQGILGAILNAAGNHSAPSTQDGNAKLDFVTEIWLQGSQWIVRSQTDRGEAYQSAAACRTNLVSDAHMILSGTAVRPLTSRFLHQNVLIVKDGAEPDAPVWKLAFVTCGSATKTDPSTLYPEAESFIQQTDGSFPPPPTARDKEQQVHNQKYIFTVVEYLANGHFQDSRSGEIFDTADDCDHYVSAQLRHLNQLQPSRIVGTSVLTTDDGASSAWLGCLHPSDVTSDAALQYFSIKMTEDRARTMSRFPVYSGSPTNPPSQRGHQVKI